MIMVTHFLAQLLGLYCVIISVAMLAQKQAMLEIITSLVQNRPTLFIVEIFGLIGGLALVLVHRLISGRHTAVGDLADFQGASDEHTEIRT